MYKVFFTWFEDRQLLENVYSVLCENGFQCPEKMVNDSREDMDRCDVLICDAFPMGTNPFSLYRVGDVYHAWDIDIPVVVIQTDPSYIQFYGGLVSELSIHGNSSVFQMYKENDIRKLPDFLKKMIKKGSKKKRVSWFLRSRKPDDSYGGDEEYLYVSFAEKDRLKAYRIIKNMQDKGYRVSYRGQDDDDSMEHTASVIQNCCCMIALISPDYMDSENCRDEISHARDLNKDRLLVYLKETELSPGMAMRLLRLQAIHKYTYKTEDEFYDKLYSAKGIEPAKT